MLAQTLWASIIFIFCLLVLIFFHYGSVLTLFFVTSLVIIETVTFGYIHYSYYILLGAILFLVWFAHRKNIVNIIKGRENKLYLYKKLRPNKARNELPPKDETKEETQAETTNETNETIR
jgi:predicted membrane protein